MFTSISKSKSKSNLFRKDSYNLSHKFQVKSKPLINNTDFPALSGEKTIVPVANMNFLEKAMAVAVCPPKMEKEKEKKKEQEHSSLSEEYDEQDYEYEYEENDEEERIFYASMVDYKNITLYEKVEDNFSITSIFF